MTRIDIQVVGTSITAKVNGKLTSGQIGAQAYFSFGPEWSSLNKIAVFRGSGKVKDRALAGSNSTTIPWEVLTQPNTRLEIGVEGRNADGSIVFPTVWCFADSVAPGANAVADPGITPSPNIYDDIMAAVGNLPGLKTEAKENLVAAINELYERGGGSADPEAVANLVEQYLKEKPPAPGEDGYSPTITTAAITGGTRLTITDKNGTKTVDVMNGAKGDTGPTGPAGPQGPAGATGADGYTPQKGVDYYTDADKQEMAEEVMAAQPKMELLHSATIPEEGLAYIDITTYKLDAVTLLINSPATTTQGKARLQVYYNGTCFYRGGDLAAADTQNRAYSQTQEIWKRNGAWRHEYYHQVTSWGIAKYADTQGKAILESDYPYIDRVLVYFFTMPAGAKIDIYGVKRNEN